MATRDELRKRVLVDRQAERERLVPVMVPEWGPDPFYIRVLSGQEQMATSEDFPDRRFVFGVLLRCLADEQGERIFEDEDYDALLQETFPVLMRVGMVALRENGMTNEEIEKAGALFGAAPAESSSID
jgi:hypothetical protein